MFLVGNFQACKHTLTRKWYFKQCICLFFLCRWNSIGFIKINLGGPNRQVVHWLQETTVFLRPLHYHPLEQNPGELGYTEDSTTQLNMDEKISRILWNVTFVGFEHWITAHLALLSWVLVHHLGLLSCHKNAIGLVDLWNLLRGSCAHQTRASHRWDWSWQGGPGQHCWRCWSLFQIRKISPTEPVEIRRSVRKYLLNTMKNGWLIFRDENGHSLFSGMYLPVQWDVRDVMVLLL